MPDETARRATANTEHPAELEVLGTQHVSRMCFVCGQQNDSGLHSHFLELADGRLCCLFTAGEEHQSYPGRVHGGILSAVMDETIGRLIHLLHPDIFAVTIDLAVKFRKPVALNTEHRVIAWVTRDTPRALEGAGQLLLSDGSVAVQATAKYLKMPVSEIAPGGLPESEWFADARAYPDKIWL